MVNAIENFTKSLEKVGKNIKSIDNKVKIAAAQESAELEKTFSLEISGFDFVAGNNHVAINGDVVNKVGLVIQNASERTDDLIKKVDSSVKQDLEAITGSAKLAADGFLNVVVSAPFPAALASSMKATTTALKSDINTIINKGLGREIQAIDSIIGDVFGTANSAAKALNDTVSKISLQVASLEKSFGNLNLGSLIENIIEDTFGNVKATLSIIAVKNGIQVTIDPKDLAKISQLISAGSVKEAAVTLAKYSDLTIEQIETRLGTIKTKASDVLVPKDPVPTKDVNVVNLTKLKNAWNEENTKVDSGIFAAVGNTENEIESLLKEFTNLKREVTSVLVVGYKGEENNSTDLHNKYASGKDAVGISGSAMGLPAHFVMSKSGLVYRGRPLEVESTNKANWIESNHYKKNIIIFINIGDSRLSPQQGNSLKWLLKTILYAQPGMQLYDKNDVGSYDPTLNNFEGWKKANLPDFENVSTDLYDPSTEDPLSPSDLIEFLNEGADHG